MKKTILLTLLTFGFVGFLHMDVSGQMMQGLQSGSDWEEVLEHTLREEQEGKELWEKLQAKEVNCADLSDHDFGTLGEYFMGTMMGDSHTAMNAMMMQVHGE